MPVAFVVVSLIAGCLLGTVALQASVRFGAKTPYTFGRAAGVYIDGCLSSVRLYKT